MHDFDPMFRAGVVVKGTVNRPTLTYLLHFSFVNRVRFFIFVLYINYLQNKPASMSQFFIYLKTEPYLAEWIKSAFGSPVRLTRDTPEYVVVKRFLSKLPENTLPDISSDFNVCLEIPWFKEKDPRVYNYMSPRAKQCLVESFECLFIRNMWTEIGSLENINCSLTNVIYAYLEKHEMSEEHWECIRQKYYRIRKRYFKENQIKIA